MRKLLILGILLCLVISLIVMVVVEKTVSNTIYLHEIFQDVAIYTTLAASFFLSKDKKLQLIIFTSVITSDLMSYLNITHGKYIYLSYALTYLMSAYFIFLSLPKYKYTIFFCIMMFTFQLFMSLDYYLAMELKIYDDPKTFMFLHYKELLYGIHLLIIGSITRWTILHKFRVYVDYCIHVFRYRVVSYFVSRVF